MQIKIRKINLSDTINIVKWRNNEKVLKYFIDKRKIDETGHINWLKTQVDTGNVEQFIIFDQDDNIDIGSVFIRDINYQLNCGEFGIFIGDDNYRNKGAGKLATKLIIDYGFNVLNLSKISLRVYSNNVRAIKSYEATGFQFDYEKDSITFMLIRNKGG